ncbi:hypothetical protein ACIHCX_10910 [Streptomyces sp. NPDC052043]|uniref:hypothetical protein n=1 Tax=Streptomyces sp. NPDC052043 TaxID=3365684 RepID=UPI0037CD26C1
MKETYRDEWRVMVTLKPRRPADLGLTGLDELAEFIAPPGPITIAVLPRRLGKLSAGMSVPDDMVSRDVDGAYRQRCDEIAAELRHRPQVDEVTVTCTETHTCSHCRCGWETLTAAEAADPANRQDEHSIEGEPVCCNWAIDEFRAERGIPRLDDGVVAYRNPDRSGVLLCREHGYAWAGLVPLKSDDLPDGGLCTYGDPADASTQCGRDVLITEAGESA